MENGTKNRNQSSYTLRKNIGKKKQNGERKKGLRGGGATKSAKRRKGGDFKDSWPSNPEAERECRPKSLTKETRIRGKKKKNGRWPKKAGRNTKTELLSHTQNGGDRGPSSSWGGGHMAGKKKRRKTLTGKRSGGGPEEKR